MFVLPMSIASSIVLSPDHGWDELNCSAGFDRKKELQYVTIEA
jgi:hypothetical protein